MNQHFDCVIIGAGVAGITSAIYLKRANKNVVIIEKNIPGGQINNTSLVENYPGFTSIDGVSLAEKITRQVKELNIPIIHDEVISIKESKIKQIVLKNKIIDTDGIIISTGRIPRKLNVINEEKYIGHGISYCAICDGFFFKNKKVCVVGGGNSAIEESLYLSNICEKVTILNRSDKLKADNYLVEQIKTKENVEILCNTSVLAINGSDIIKSVETNNGIINCDGLFVYIGLVPTTDFLSDLNINLDNGYIIVDQNMKTNISGIYACGDVIKKNVYQIVTASGEGAIAATSFEKNY